MTSNQPNSLAKAAFVLILLTPAVFTGLYPFDVNLMFAVSAALLFICTLGFQIKRLYLPRSFTIAVAALLAAQSIPFMSGDLLAPGAWRLQAVLYSTAAAMLVMGASIPSYSLKTWMHLYMSVAVFWSAIGLFVWLGGSSGMPLGIGPVAFAMGPAAKLTGPFNQGNIFATAIGFAWIFAHWLFITKKKNAYAAAIVFFTAMFVDSMSRGGLLAYLTTIALLLFALKPSLSLFVRQLLPLWISGLVIGLLFFSFSHPQLQENLLIPSASSSLYARLVYWISAVVEFLGSPWIGVGWGQYGANYWTANPQAQSWLLQNFDWSHAPNANAFSAHNLFLHALAEGGLVAAMLILWGTWKILIGSVVLLKKANSRRLPFALAAIGFVLHAQANVVFTRPIPLLMAAFFTGIALAPWLRKNSWKLVLAPRIRRTALAMTVIAVLWTTPLCIQWFSAEQAMRNLDINDKASVDRLVEFTSIPRIATVSFVWLGYTVIKEKKHLALLVWMLPYLKSSLHEIPSLSNYQILFYAMVTAGKLDEACRLGKIISDQHFPGEPNNPAYDEVCANKMPTRYKIGH